MFMMLKVRFFVLSTICLCLLFCLIKLSVSKRLDRSDIIRYRDKVKSSFYFAYENYLQNAFEYDELKPISCEGTNTWGNFHLSLIDSLDMLIILNNYTEFDRVSQFIIKNLNFDYDLNVSVFETNIRIVGGLLSAHLLSHKAYRNLPSKWPCDGPLLRLAKKVALKLLPAFNTPTGMPYGTINLLHGVPVNETPITCTAGIGTFMLEFATLSRLTGDNRFEFVAKRALNSLHKYRSDNDLVGNHINVSDGNWVATDSSIGAGIDSFFEYLVKGSILMQDQDLLKTFSVYFSSINKFMKNSNWHFPVNMRNGQTTMTSFQSLEAFWPGLLTLIGKIDDAKKSLLNNHLIWKQYGFIPEYYDVPSSNIKRDGYPLRPEHIESIYYLYKATKNEKFLEFGIDVFESIEHSAKTECGYATVKEVKNHLLEDRMESFFLAETLKYLYLLFDEESFLNNNGQIGVNYEFPLDSNNKLSCVIDSGSYVFNTEAHPIDISLLNCCQRYHNRASKISLKKTFLQMFDKQSHKKIREKKKTKSKLASRKFFLYFMQNKVFNFSLPSTYNLVCYNQSFLKNFYQYWEVFPELIV